jgi:hypothetical protein
VAQGEGPEFKPQYCKKTKPKQTEKPQLITNYHAEYIRIAANQFLKNNSVECEKKTSLSTSQKRKHKCKHVEKGLLSFISRNTN